MACDVSVKLSAFSNFAEKTNYLDPVVTAHSTGDGTVDHVRNFLDSIKSRAESVCNIDEAVRSDTLCHISEIAIRLNRKVVFDPKKERFINDEEANLRLLARKMRSPWHL